jgi:hypothetical protein
MMDASDLSVFVRRSDGVAAIDLAIDGISTSTCIPLIEQAIKRLPAVICSPQLWPLPSARRMDE